MAVRPHSGRCAPQPWPLATAVCIQTIFDENYVEFPFADYETKELRDAICPGDYAAIRDWDSMLAEFGLETTRNAIATPHAVFLEEMRPLCGRIVRVTGLNPDCRNAVDVELFRDDESVNHLMRFYFNRDMLRTLTDVERENVEWSF